MDYSIQPKVVYMGHHQKYILNKLHCRTLFYQFFHIIVVCFRDKALCNLHPNQYLANVKDAIATLTLYSHLYCLLLIKINAKDIDKELVLLTRNLILFSFCIHAVLIKKGNQCNVWNRFWRNNIKLPLARFYLLL